jgi:hypothetical protein
MSFHVTAGGWKNLSDAISATMLLVHNDRRRVSVVDRTVHIPMTGDASADKSDVGCRSAIFSNGPVSLTHNFERVANRSQWK